jgi:hypothetical protein
VGIARRDPAVAGPEASIQQSLIDHQHDVLDIDPAG